MAVAGMALAASAYAGPTWDEQINGGGDAGQLPGTAQITSGSGPLTAITGMTGFGDDVDMYWITITDAAAFSASTVGGTTFDTQLWLFDANGFGLLGNDDSVGLQSTISFPAADGPNAGQIPGGSFMALLAISGFNNDPTSAGGPIFNQQSFAQISGPDGAGGGSPLTGWTGGGATGPYTITLNGATFYIPTPGALGLFGIAGLAAARRRRA